MCSNLMRANRMIVAVFFVIQVISFSSTVAQVSSLRVGLPSPTAASLGKFAEIPVSLYTGTPNISIPLFEVKGRVLSVPISLNYHGSGEKVDDYPGWIGIGWSLTAGGVIARTVRGIPDEELYGYFNTEHYLDDNWPIPQTSYLNMVKNEEADSEPDLFFFNFGGYSGQFVFSPAGIRTIPYQKLKIEWNLNATWKITTEDGTKYYFEETELTTDISTTLGSIPQKPPRTFTSSWYLARIESGIGSDAITFSYQGGSGLANDHTTYVERDYALNYGFGQWWFSFMDSLAVYNRSEIQPKYLSTVTSSSHVASFAVSSKFGSSQLFVDSIMVYSNGVQIKKLGFQYSQSTGRITLTSLTEYGNDGSSLPGYQLEYNTVYGLPAQNSNSVDFWGYFNGKQNGTRVPTYKDATHQAYYFGADRRPDAEYTLEGILKKITYPTGGYSEFTFEAHEYSRVGGSAGVVTTGYGTPFAVVSFSSFGDIGIDDIDTFMVGGSQSQLIALDVRLNQPGLSYNPDNSQVATVTLETVSGSPIRQYTSNQQFSKIEYIWLSPGTYRLTADSESEDIGGTLYGSTAYIGGNWEEALSATKRITGGARIKRIRVHDGVDASRDIITDYVYKTYSEPDTSLSSGVLVTEPRFFHFESPGYDNQDHVHLSAASKSPLGTTHGSFIGYREVTELRNVNGQYGRTTHRFRSAVEVGDLYINSTEFGSMTSYDWKRGQLLSREEKDNICRTKERTELTYAFRDEGNEPTTTKIYRGLMVKYLGDWGNQPANPMYRTSEFEIISAWSYPESDTITTYDQNGQNPMVTTKNYYYNNPNHIQLSKVEETNSDGTKRITRMKYPWDFSTPATSDPVVQAIDSMKNNNHIHTAVIEKFVTQQKPGFGEEVISADVTKYKKFATSQILPWEQWSFKNADPVPLTGVGKYDTARVFNDVFVIDSRHVKTATLDKYNTYGQLLQGKDANNIPITTKWSYNSAVPVASFTNAFDSLTFVDEFGDGDSLGWVITDVGGDGDTHWQVDNGVMIQTNYASAANEENDRIVYDLGTEIAGDVVFEFDLRIADSNWWDLWIAAGGDSWTGGNGGSECAVWTAFSNENWAYYNGSAWVNIQLGMTIGRTYHLKIVAKCGSGKADYYVDGARLIKDGPFRMSTSGIRKIAFGNYGYSSVTAVWNIDNVRLYPATATVVSGSYDLARLVVNEVQDENGSVKAFSYDSFGRLTKQLVRVNGFRALVGENRYQYSRTVGDVFSSSRPNSVENVRYESSTAFSDFSSSAGWGVSGDITFNVQMAGETTVRMGTLSGGYDYIYKAAGSGHRIARVDFYPDDSTGSLPHVLAFDDGSWRFAVLYNATGSVWNNNSQPNTFILQDLRNGYSTQTYTYFNSFVAPRNRWYTVEIEKSEGGEMYAYVYPKGSGRIYATGYSHYVGGFLANWNANVKSWSNDDYYYLANHYVGLPDHGEVFSDGLGRDIQQQHQLKLLSIVSSTTTYDSLGRAKKSYKPYDLDFLGVQRHRYDPNYQANSSSEYPADGGFTYAEMQYLKDPLDRPEKQGEPGTTHRLGSGNEVKIEYFTEPSTNRLKNRQTDEDGKMTYTYVDKFGNTVRSVVDSGGLNLATAFEYDVMGKMKKATAPNNLITTYAYTTQQKLRETTSPDAGTTQYFYDKNGNLRLVKDANHFGNMNSVNISAPGGYVEVPYRTTGQFTLGMPGKTFVSITPIEIEGSETMTVRIKKNGAILCTVTTSGWYGAGNSVSLPAGTYDYEVFTAGSWGFYQYWITCNSGYEIIYHKYDALNRILETGEYETSSTGNFTQLNADNASFPTTGQILDKTFSYDIPSTDALAAGQKNVAGKLAVANSYDKGTWKWTTFYSYNDLGLVEWVVQKNAWGKAWKITYEYDLQGRATKKSFADSYNGYNLYTYNEYDQVGRLTKVSTNSVDNPGTATKEAEYRYRASGKPDTLFLGNTAQTISYAYNERDFVKQISSAKFLQNLYYHAPPAYLTSYARKNGNIAAIEWNTNSLGQLSYGFNYDNSNRLTAAQTYTGTSTTNNWRIGGISYDGAGNILKMLRYGFNGSWMDSLTYNAVPNKNQLDFIRDQVASGSYGSDIDNQTLGNYKYDANGNATQDIGSALNWLSYNIQNLPIWLIKNSTSYSASYDANDRRVYSSENSRFYINGADGKTEAVVDLTSPGIITHNIWGNDLVGQVKRNGGLTRYYHLKDHLGSVRVMVDATGIVVAYDDYDPWGMILETRSYNAGLADARFKFISKERDAQTGIFWLDSRGYDGRTGKFFVADALRDRPDLLPHSPYHYSFNNPLRFKDPGGKSPVLVVGGVALGVGEATVLALGALATVFTATHQNEIASGLIQTKDWVNKNVNEPLIEQGKEAFEATTSLIGSLFKSENAKAKSEGTAAKSGTEITFGEGAKSKEKYEEKVREVKQGKERLKDLESQLGNAKGPKAQRPIKELIEQAKKGIEGHEKQIKQKWGEKALPGG